MNRVRAWLHRVALAPLMAQLNQGLTPKRLAVTLAIGLVCGLVPFPAVSTLTCVLVALLFKLNQPAIQVANYGAGAGQIVMLLPFIRLGEALFSQPPLPLSSEQLWARMQEDTWGFVHDLWDTLWHAVAAWALLSPILVGLFYLALLPLTSGLLRRARAPAPPNGQL